MSPWETSVIWVSASGALLSAIGCSWAAFKVVSWKFGALLKASLILSATMAIAYCLSYLWLLSHQDQVEQWSRVMRPVGMISWIFGPWTALPLALIRQVLKLRHRMVNEAKQVIEGVREGTPSVPLP